MKIFFAILISVSWISAILFSMRFLFRFFREEKMEHKHILWLASIAFLMLFCSFTLTPSGGYDIECVFKIIGNSFFDLGQLFSDKEIAPIFIKEMADRAAGFSLYGFLTLNRIIPAITMILFYAGMRQSRLNAEICLVSSALLFLNFNIFFNAASFNTAPIILFAYVSFISAFMRLSAKNGEEGLTGIIWLFSAAIVLVLSRMELGPVIFIIMLACAINLAIKDRNFLKSPGCIMSVSAGSILLLLSFLLEITYSPSSFLKKFTPASNFNMQLIMENLTVLFSEFPHKAVPAAFRQFSIAAALLSAFFILPLFSIKRFSKNKTVIIAYSAFLSAAVYSCLVYRWQEKYPLEFIRHRAFLYVPFACISAYSIQAAYTFFKGKEKAFRVMLLTASIIYSALNLRTASIIDKNFAGDIERTEWKLLIKSQNTIGKKYKIKTLFKLPPYDDLNLKKKFFEHYYNRGKNDKYPEIIYISLGELAGIITPQEKENLKKNLVPVETWGQNDILKPGFYIPKRGFDVAKSAHYTMLRYGIDEIIYGDYSSALKFFDKAAEQECGSSCFYVYKMLASAAAGNISRANEEAEAIKQEIAASLRQGNETNIETAMRQAAEDGGKKLKISAQQCLGYDMRFCEKLLWDYMANPLYID